MIEKLRRYAPIGNAWVFCLGKTRWLNEKTAQRSLSSLRADNPGAFDSTVRPYRCPVKGKRTHWHLGHGS